MNKTDKGVLITLIGLGILSLAGTWIWTINQENEEITGKEENMLTTTKNMLTMEGGSSTKRHKKYKKHTKSQKVKN
jgi:hypothetical protein